jgi:hypothetical protein
MSKAYRETTPTRERICINGLWRWQPAETQSQQVPAENWGYFKVPGSWPGVTDYMQKDSQTVYSHPSWASRRLGDVTAAWYERDIAIPADWAGRRITLSIEYLILCGRVDGCMPREIQFPRRGRSHCDVHPGGNYRISLLRSPCRSGVMLSIRTARRPERPGVRGAGEACAVMLITRHPARCMGDVR